MPNTTAAALLTAAPAHPGRLTGGKVLDPANPMGDLAARVANAQRQPTVFAHCCGLIHASKAAKRAASKAADANAFALAHDLLTVASWLHEIESAMD